MYYMFGYCAYQMEFHSKALNAQRDRIARLAFFFTVHCCFLSEVVAVVVGVAVVAAVVAAAVAVDFHRLDSSLVVEHKLFA